MSKRTYKGPIIERHTEEGIALASGSKRPAPDYHLAVDAVTGDLILLLIVIEEPAVDGNKYEVSYFMPVSYSRINPRGKRFHVVREQETQ